MTTVIIIVHVIVCIALICIVLLQTGKGASLGAAFGGSTQTVFGATGSTGFFGKLTTTVAIIFMVTSLTLTYLSAHRGGRTIMKEPAAQEETAPAAVPEQATPEDAAVPEQAPGTAQPTEPAAQPSEQAVPSAGQTTAPEAAPPAPPVEAGTPK